MAISAPLRHELKYFINELQYRVLAGVLSRTLQRDTNAGPSNEYHIRSLYFDTYTHEAMTDKLDGVKSRDKYRIRIYNLSDRMIRVECKSKVGSLISKRSVRVPRELAEQLIAADPTGLELTRSGLLRDVYREMKINLLHPVVLVDYVREAYTYPAEEVRVTFDKRLHTGMRSIDLFNPRVPVVPTLDNNEIILEVKYNRVMPPFIRDILSAHCTEAQRSAISKYTLCRRFEGFE